MAQNRNTSQKMLVRQLLDGNYTHPTADAVYEAARKIDPVISRGTVYRNLKMLSDSGEILKIMTPLGPDHYDFNTREHEHFLCRNCKKTMDVNLKDDVKPSIADFSLKGCVVENMQLLLVGLCPDCTLKNETAKSLRRQE